ncbi:MAG: phage tail sheath family protein [Anaerolineales bacterium]|nr:phage tail sheath family protein [Anaerolineales bacterium]
MIFTKAPPSGEILVSYCAKESSEFFAIIYPAKKEELKVEKADQTTFVLQNSPVLEGSGSVSKNGTTVELKNDFPKKGQSSAVLTPGLGLNDTKVTVTYNPVFRSVLAGEVKPCTNFGEFKKHFGDFTADENQNRLAHAVYGFFNNGGTRCYVARVENEAKVEAVLEKFEAIDEIAIVAAPGLVEDSTRTAIVSHCEKMEDRFAVLDSKEMDISQSLTKEEIKPPAPTNYAAFYFPRIKVFDPVTKAMDPKGDGQILVPPSGHIAGIYARVDASRGVHKAPANEVVRGALGLERLVSRSQQEGLNPDGINCIRDLNDNIRVWGARTIGGDGNGEWKYINVRRLFLFLRESIDEGLQWTVFEPNDSALWAKIRRNITAFLMNVWRSGALFGATPQDAFYVKCDEETNPPEVRDLGQVVTEIGVAVVKPAEFVIFKISQWAGPSGG